MPIVWTRRSARFSLSIGQSSASFSPETASSAGKKNVGQSGWVDSGCVKLFAFYFFQLFANFTVVNRRLALHKMSSDETLDNYDSARLTNRLSEEVVAIARLTFFFVIECVKLKSVITRKLVRHVGGRCDNESSKLNLFTIIQSVQSGKRRGVTRLLHRLMLVSADKISADV